MRALALFVLAATAVASTWASDDGSIIVSVDGNDLTKYVLSSSGDKGFVYASNNTIILKGGGRIYIGDSPSDTTEPSSFYEMPLLGKRFKVDIDLSQVDCGCNAAIYAVSMPAYNSAQQPQPGGDGQYYCDANQVGGTYCPEMDISEANKYAMASTPHTCAGFQPPHYYDYCDRAGCGTNILDALPGQFGPGKEIDTNRPYTLSVAFITDSQGELSVINNYFWQEGKSVQFNSCNNGGYLRQFSSSLKGMVLTISLWVSDGGGMSWLDGKSGCQENCNLSASKAVFSNLRLETL